MKELEISGDVFEAEPKHKSCIIQAHGNNDLLKVYIKGKIHWFSSGIIIHFFSYQPKTT